jgi:AAHS family 4-hydroxybenzoate transporter-like MFS transporter
MVTTIDVAEFIDKHNVSRFQIQILILCVVAMMIDGFDAQSIGFVVPAIAGQWGVAQPMFGPVFAAGLFGMALGALLFGVLADHFGRKKVIVFCMAFFGVFTLAKVLATSITGLLVLQFIAGLGVGGVMPNAYALIAEYAPRHRRALMITIAGCGYSLGASGAGLLTAQLLASYGWQSLFYIGGIISLLAVPLLMIGLPESIRFLVLLHGAKLQLERVLKKIDAGLQTASQLHVVSSEKKAEGVPVVHLLSHGRAPSTLLLWLAAFMDLIIIYYMTSWLPAMLHDTGLTMEKAALGAALYSAAGIVGGPVVGSLMDRFGVFGMLALAFALAAAFIVLLGSIGGGSFILLCLVIFGVGFFSVGGHLGIGALAGEIYPTFMRSTGVGWALGIGRFCSVISPMIGGILLSWHWSRSSIFSTVAVPAFAAAVAIMLIKAVSAPEALRNSKSMNLGVVGSPESLQ